MSKLKGYMAEMLLMAAIAGGGMSSKGRNLAKDEEEDFKRKAKARAKNLSAHWNGQQQMHTFTIKGIEIKATDKKTAQKIYNLHHKK